MSFEELIKEKVNKKLNKNVEYLYLSKLDEEFKNLTDKHHEYFYISVFESKPWEVRCKKFFGLNSFKDAREFMETYSHKKNELEELQAKNSGFFHRRKYNELSKKIEELDEKAKFCQQAIELDDEWKEKKEEYEKDRISARLYEVKENTIRKVLKKNRNDPSVEEAFYNSIAKNGEVSSSYDGNGIVPIAYRVVDKEVKTMLMKTKYKDQINEVKSQFEDVKE